MTGPGRVVQPDAPDPLAQQRAAADAARRALRESGINLQRAKDALDDLKRSSAGQGAAQAIAAAEARVTAAAGARTEAATHLKTTVAAIGPLIVAAVPLTPEAEVARLAADRPIVLLPVRLETRFVGNDLLLRVYPDDVFADSHEPELTDVEVEDGKQFWEGGWADEAAERLAWKALVDAVGAPRAAWIAERTQPANLNQRPGTLPVFPAIARRESAWTTAAEARLLPDRWIITLYRGATERSVTSSTVREPLALTMSPAADEPRSALSDDGLQMDDASRWTVDFEAAVLVGMAVRIPLTPAERAAGFERVVVVGVKSTLAPELVPAALGTLLDSHRYGRGVSVLAQGTQTNNTAGGSAPFPTPDPDARLSFDAARRTLTSIDNRDGGRLMRAFGLPATAAAHWPGADRRSEDVARAMARALWPATLSYFLDQMMAPVFGPEAIGEAQRFFVDFVRGRGPLAAFRIGNTPYGVLPVSSLARWRAEKPDTALDNELPKALRQLLPLWTAQVGSVPRVGRTPGDPDADLLGILGMDASTREVRVRTVLGEDVQWNIFGFFGWADPWGAWWDAGQRMAGAVFERLGFPEWEPRIKRANFADTAWPFGNKLVSDDPVAEHDTLSPNYLDWIRTAPVPDLLTEMFPSGWTRTPRSLLYKLLRHASLLEYHDASYALLVNYGRAEEFDRREHELIGLPGQASGVNRIKRLAESIPQLTGNQPLHVFLGNPANAATLRAVLPQQQVVGFREALAALAPLTTAELERLFTETLDVTSHRIDAWITALAAKRLDRMRVTEPVGSHLGAYGWVENLVARPAAPGAPVAVSPGVAAQRQSGNGGFVQAPSLMHAAAAAVLRNAYLSRSGAGQEQFAIDLSSARVRAGRFLLDAVREGQPLGAVLGYQVERGLHDRLQDVAIDPLRRVYPLVAGKSNDPADAAEPQEQIAARNVVDGLALRTAYRDRTLTAATLGLPVGGPAWLAVEAEVVRLDAAVDAVADLLLAESIYQLVKGSPGAAAATLDAMAQGGVRPPDPEIATVPRRGTPLTHRVAIVLGSGPAALPAGWPGAPTPRAELEPWVDAWLGQLFGNPSEIECEVEFGPMAAPTGSTTVGLNLLGLRPIDVLALARALGGEERGAVQAGASELDRRVRDAAFTKAGITADVEARITYGRPAAGFDPVTERTFADVLELVRSFEQVLRLSRPLTPSNLVAEDRGQDASTADLLPADALARADQACTRLQTALNAIDAPLAAAIAAAADAPFDLTTLRTALAALALSGVPGAYPVNSLGSEPELRPPLIAQAKSMLKEGRDRLAEALALTAEAGDPSHAADAAYQVKAATGAAALAMGNATPFLPRFKLRPAGAPNPSVAESELGNALAHWTDAGFIAADAPGRGREVGRFEIVASRVRQPLDAWRRLEVAAGLMGRSRTSRLVAQLPYESGARWAALPFADQAHRPRAGCLSILMHRVAAPASSDSWAGFLLDQWVEQIAQPVEQTGIAFHYDDPGAEAPQTILLAVPPVRGGQWDLASLLAILNETLDLAKVRAVDGELLGTLGQVLPAIYLADSPEEVTVRTDFAAWRQTEAKIMKYREE